jgi:sulfur relay (sulfurtransferase) complex TusBCD TusD component (DsrE family)
MDCKGNNFFLNYANIFYFSSSSYIGLPRKKTSQMPHYIGLLREFSARCKITKTCCTTCFDRRKITKNRGKKREAAVRLQWVAAENGKPL